MPKESRDIYGRPLIVATAEERERYPRVAPHGHLNPAQLSLMTMVTRSGGKVAEVFNLNEPRHCQATNRARKGGYRPRWA